MESRLTPEEARDLFAPHRASWWVAGGRAIDLFLGRETRPHDDLDIAVLRREQHEVRLILTGWDLYVAVGPERLERWQPGDPLDPQLHAVWCRRTPTQPWEMELLFNDSDGDAWLFRRDNRVRLPLADLGGVTEDRVPFLRPEVVLLYKAKRDRPVDDADLSATLPALDDDARRWLADSIELVHRGHRWSTMIRDR